METHDELVRVIRATVFQVLLDLHPDDPVVPLEIDADIIARALTREITAAAGEHFGHVHLRLDAGRGESTVISAAAESAGRELLEWVSRVCFDGALETERRSAMPGLECPNLEQVHRSAMDVTTQSMAQDLQETLSRRLTAYLAGVRDGKTVARWVSGEVTDIRDRDMEQRVRTAHLIVVLLRGCKVNPRTMRAWFISYNPWLGGTPPADAILEGRLQEAVEAAQVYLAHP